jgi:S-adenosylmethionine uptake transporter
MQAHGHDTPGRTLSGIAHALAGFSIFSIQDAIVKWLVTSLPVWEILFFRSVVIVTILTGFLGPQHIIAVIRGPNRRMLILRSALILGAWLAYFTAARSLHLAELVTIYFSTPVFVVVLSIIALKERVGPARWAATTLGFFGVVIATNPTGSPPLGPILLTLLAAFMWAWTNILVRIMSRNVTTVELMIASNALFVIVCGLALPFMFVTPDLFSLGLLAGLGVVGTLGQYLLFEGYRLAPASAIAPFEYVTLIWAFVWGYLIWQDWPGVAVFQGAALILLSGVGILAAEAWRAGRKSAGSPS